MTITVSLLLSIIVAVLFALLQLFVDVGNMPILLLYTIDFNTIREFYVHNFYITIPLILYIFYLLLSQELRYINYFCITKL